MKNKPLDLLKQLMDKPENMTMDNMDNLVKNSLEFFSEYMDLAKNGTEEAKDKALKEILEFKESIQNISQKVTAETGLSTSDLFDLIKNPENFSKEQWASMKGINETITEFNTSLLAEIMPNIPKAGSASKKQRISI